MPKVTVDFSQVEEFEPLEKGEYECIIEQVEYREATSEDKYDYLNAQFLVTEDGNDGRKLWKVWSLSPKALWRMKQDFENLGLPVDEIEIDYDDETMLVTEPDFEGMPCVCVVSQRTYEGRLQNQVDVVLSLEDKPVAKSTKKAPGVKNVKEKAGAKKKFK